VVSTNWRGVRRRELLPPSRLRTPAFARGAEMRWGPPPGNVTRSQTSQDPWRCATARKAWPVMRTQGKQDVVREDVSWGRVGRDLTRTGLPKPSPSERSLSKRSTIAGNYDPLYLFACHSDWQYRRNLAAYQGLVSALDDSDHRIREIAEMLLHRSSPRPPRKSRGGYR
jgi:hypothetical protein